MSFRSFFCGYLNFGKYFEDVDVQRVIFDGPRFEPSRAQRGVLEVCSIVTGILSIFAQSFLVPNAVFDEFSIFDSHPKRRKRLRTPPRRFERFKTP